MIIEQDYFQFITESAHLNTDGKDRIYYAELFEFFSYDAFRNFSIKIPLQGIVYYQTENLEFKLAPGSFLLSHQQQGKVVIDSSTLVRSIAIDISRDTINEAFHSIKSTGNHDLNNLQPGYFFSADFFENVYSLEKDLLGMRLKNIISDLDSGNTAVSHGFFLNLATEIILHELGNFKSLENLRPSRSSTKRELLKRLLRGRNFIDDNYLVSPGITEIAMACNMSSFNFFRNFKQAFGTTPYQYMMKKRLDYAKSQLLQGSTPTSIAMQCGFPDIFTFSKAFKRTFGYSPVIYKRILVNR